MIDRIIEFSARNRLLVILTTAAAVIMAVRILPWIPLDAIPDLSDTQVIIYSRWDRSPDIVEDQVTYPIVAALLGTPKIKAIRGFSDFGFSYVYVIFQDGTDLYWARSRVLEYLSKIQGSLPAGVKTELGPDATGVGWVFQYALTDRSGKQDLASLRSYQDWYLRYALQSVPGVAEVASVGGFQKQYQVTVDPARLQAYGVSILDAVEAIRKSNGEVGGRLMEWSGKEYMVRGRGYVRRIQDLEEAVVRADSRGTPLRLGDIAHVTLGPQIRRGLADLNGNGDAVGGIVVMRHGENALNVIAAVKERLAELKNSFPAGVELVTTYDRSELIRESIETLKDELFLEMAIVSAVILFFLWHVPSALVPIVTIPVSVLLAFIPMYYGGIGSNIMSLAGIAISIGVLVDGAIVEVENAYKKLELWNAGGRPGDLHTIRLEALKEVGPSVFFSLLVIAVSFLPIFTLVDQEGRLFKPLAYTKTLAMAAAAVLAVTLDPAVRMLFTRMDPFRFRPRFFSGLINIFTVGRYYPEEKHPVSRILFWLYEGPCRLTLRFPWAVIVLAVLVVLTTGHAYLQLGQEFMPPLNEGSILYMPTTMPGISVTEAQKLLETQDRLIRSIPEVETVFGKAGRAETSTDPAPFSMMETTVLLKPRSEWRFRKQWHSDLSLPSWAHALLRSAWPERIRWEELIEELDHVLQIPGNTNAWTMPIKARIDMLTTGVRTPLGLKILGADLNVIQELGTQLEHIIREVPGTRSVFSERAAGGYFVDIGPRRTAIARYGLSIEEVQMVIMAALGGETVANTIEGRERYSINLRYPRDYRMQLEKVERILVPAADGRQIPLGLLADVSLKTGPSMIRNENGMLAGYVYVDIEGRDIGTYVEEARAAVEKKWKPPAGYTVLWSGQYENILRVRERLKFVVPLTILLIFFLLYMNTRSWFKTIVVMLAVPFSLVGAVWLLYFLEYHVSIAVWVGMIALMGLDAETGVFMLLFLDLSYEEARRQGRLNNLAELKDAVLHGAVKRIRPKMMTVAAATMGLLPILWSTGTGADLMKRVAAPMVGGLATSFIMELLVYPPIYLLWKKRLLPKESGAVQTKGQ